MNTDQLNKFDELIREKLSHYEPEPDMDLMTQIHARKNRFMRFKSFQKAIILLLLLLVGVTGAYFLTTALQQTDDTVKQTTTNSLKASNKILDNKKLNLVASNAAHLKATSSKTTTLPSANNENNHQLVNKNMAASVGYSVLNDVQRINKIDINKNIKQNDKPFICTANFSYTKHKNGVLVFNPEFSVDKNLELTWHFGDGLTSKETNPAHIYTNGNKYLVELIVTNKQNHCKAQQVKTIEVTKLNYAQSSTISGTVFSHTQYSQKHQVDLLVFNFKTNTYQLAQNTLTNEHGYYEFTNVASGKYLIASAGNQYYLPTFYGNTTQQHYATSITVFLDEHKHFKNYDIQLINLPNIASSMNNNVDTETTVMLAYDNNSNTVKTIKVNKNGKVVSNLPNGNYTLVNPVTGEVSGGLEVIDGVSKFIESEDAGGSNLSGVVNKEAELNLVPNPANNAVSVKLSSNNNALIDVRIFNSNGAIVRQFNLNANSSTDNINISDLPAGYYYVVATQNGKRSTKTLIKASDNSK